MNRRRIRLGLGIGVAIAGVGYLALPAIVEQQLRTRLVENGFPDASLAVASVGWSHLQLRDVHLQSGVELGTIDLDRGVNALWRGVNKVAVSDAKISIDKLGDLAGRIAKLRAHRSEVVADISIDGELDADRVDVGPYSLERVHVPFAYSRQGGVQVRGGRAQLAGGQLTLDTRATSLVLTARGLQLNRLLAPTKRVTGTGLVDGEVSVDLDAPTRARGELRARGTGTLKAPGLDDNRVTAALADFAYERLTAKLGEGADDPDLVVAVRGRGRRNDQQVEMSINVRGVRPVAARYLGGER